MIEFLSRHGVLIAFVFSFSTTYMMILLIIKRCSRRDEFIVSLDEDIRRLQLEVRDLKEKKRV